MRFGLPVKKQWLRMNETPLWLYVTQHMRSLHAFEKVVVVAPNGELAYMRTFCDDDTHFVPGDSERQASLQAALAKIETPFVLVHDAARVCIDEAVVGDLIAQVGNADCIVPYLDAIDTVYLDEMPIDRSKVKLIQTPQLSRTQALKEALNTSTIYSDESSAIKANGGSVAFVKGSKKMQKLTYADQLNELACLKPPSQKQRIGYGIDTHAFYDGEGIRLCGVDIAYTKSFKAHSDGDVAIHALIDAILGACAIGDIGELFPDTDDSYKGIDSTKLLQNVSTKIASYGFVIDHIDLTVILEAPKLKPYKEQMKQTLATILDLKPNQVSIKATTSEKLGFIGRGEGASVHAAVTVSYFDWKAKGYK